MQKNKISLLYPSEEARQRKENGKDNPKISIETLDSLGLNEAIELKNSCLCDYFTMDKEVIEYRQRVFEDLLENEELTELLYKIEPLVADISALRKLSLDAQSDSYLYSITEIELYISVMQALSEELSKIKDKLKSDAFNELYKIVYELTESEYYKDLNKRLQELTSRVREVKSVTIGVNLDSRLRPESAGVLSVNNEYFKSGELLQKILRLDFKSNEYTCIAALVPFEKGQTENQQGAMNTAFNNALNTVFKSSMRSWKKMVQTYVLENADFLIKLVPELEFLVRATEMIKTLKSGGNSLVFPEILPVSEKCYDVKGLYNPVVAWRLGSKMVENDIVFDKNGSFYVLSGPNRGGKSVITCAVGLSMAFAQLGLCVPASSAKISPCDGIFTHFPTDADDTIDKGRLGEECARLDEIFDDISEYSLVLLDESLSSTGSYEASYIAAEVLGGLSMVGSRGIFSTHLHELCNMLGEINERSKKDGGSPIDTLVAGMEEGERSFKICRKKPDGKSYARDIASKYGISREHIMKKIEKNK